MEKLYGAAVVGQSGGPTAAINATLTGVIRSALSEVRNGGCITGLFGMRHGVEGFLKKDLIDLDACFSGDDAEEELALLSHTPGAALGSCRKKLPKPEDGEETYRQLLAVFQEYNIRYFFYIGGNDSMDTVAKLSAYFQKCAYDCRVVGLPKTIDNDLMGTDHTPGFGSAAKYVATTVQEIIRDCAAYTIPAVTIVEVMGRDSGWLTTAAGLPRLISGYGPDAIYLPERPFSDEQFLADMKAALEKHPNVVAAVSEGIRYADGQYAGAGAQSGAADVFGHQYLAGTGKYLERLVKGKLGCKVRSVELNISQRCGAHIASWADLDEAECCGESGVEAACDGQSGCMIAMERVGEEGDPYAIVYRPRGVASIANQIKTVPDPFINEAGNNVTDACLEYLKPLIAGEVPLEYRDGLPRIFVFPDAEAEERG